MNRLWIVCALLLCALPLHAQEEAEKKTDFLNPSGGQLSIGAEEGFGIGTALGDPSALWGPDRTEVVLPGSTRSATINLTTHYLHKTGPNSRILLELNGDPNFVGGDLSYSVQPEGWNGAFTANVFVASGLFAPFENYEPREVLLPGGEEPWLQQLGGGVEYVHEFNPDLDVAFGLNYQAYGYSTDLVGGTRFPVDLYGNRLVRGRDATRGLFSFNVHGIYSTVDDRNLPTEGTKLRFGMEQGLGDDGDYNRLATNVAHLFRVPGPGDGPHSLLLNLQAGTILGRAPLLRGFHLGGPFSVRGYDVDEMASGESFLTASAEYRMHLTSFNVMETDIGLRAALFYDYGTTFSTGRDLVGQPEFLLDKPTSGSGYGLGLHFATPGGLFKIEQAWNDEGEPAVYLSVGERF